MKAPKGKYDWTATVGEKGQIVIPKQARDLFEIKPGDTLLLLGDEKAESQYHLKEHLLSCLVWRLKRRRMISNYEDSVVLYPCSWSYQSDTWTRYGSD